MSASRFEVLATAPLAADSADHLHPFGTAQDNSRNRRFNEKLYALWPGKTLRILDIGCAGGGFVADCVADGHEAIGIEGSDYSKSRGRAEWATIPERLFVVDATKKFCVGECGQPGIWLFDVVTSWEVLEHIQESDLQAFFDNVRFNLQCGGLFIASIATFEAEPHHVTVKPREWWMEVLAREGFKNDPALVEYFGGDWIRGDGNEPDRRFHVVLSLK